MDHNTISTQPYYDPSDAFKVKLDPDEYGGGADFFQREGKRKKKKGAGEDDAKPDEVNPIPSTHPDIHDDVKLSSQAAKALENEQAKPVHFANNPHKPKDPPRIHVEA